MPFAQGDTRPMDPHTPPLDPLPRVLLAFDDLQRLLLDAHTGVVMGLDLDGRLRWLNAAGQARLGYAAGEFDGVDLAGTVLTQDELDRHAAALSGELGEPVAANAAVLGVRLLRGLPPQDTAWMLRHKDGSPQPTRLAMGALRNDRGEVVGLVAVEPTSPHNAPLRFAHHDNLTGLPNRAVLADRAEMALQRATRQGTVLALLLIEIVGFDALCAERGRSVGDDLLRATASRLHFELRKTDTAVRLEGGQFAALLVDLNHADEAMAVAGKVRQALSAKVNVGVAILPLDVRVGIAWFPEHGDQLLPLLEAAEAALGTLGPDGDGLAAAAAG